MASNSSQLDGGGRSVVAGVGNSTPSVDYSRGNSMISGVITYAAQSGCTRDHDLHHITQRSPDTIITSGKHHRTKRSQQPNAAVSKNVRFSEVAPQRRIGNPKSCKGRKRRPIQGRRRPANRKRSTLADSPLSAPFQLSPHYPPLTTNCIRSAATRPRVNCSGFPSASRLTLSTTITGWPSAMPSCWASRASTSSAVMRVSLRL